MEIDHFFYEWEKCWGKVEVMLKRNRNMSNKSRWNFTIDKTEVEILKKKYYTFFVVFFLFQFCKIFINWSSKRNNKRSIIEYWMIFSHSTDFNDITTPTTLINIWRRMKNVYNNKSCHLLLFFPFFFEREAENFFPLFDSRQISYQCSSFVFLC